jgi:hypothetical protein
MLLSRIRLWAPSKHAGCSISSGIYVVTAEAETGCPRPSGRFPCWRAREASGGSSAPGPVQRPGCNRAAAEPPGTSNPAMAPERVSTEPSPGSHVNAGNSRAPGIRRPGCNRAARLELPAHPGDSESRPWSGASRAGCASTAAIQVSSVYSAVFQIRAYGPVLQCGGELGPNGIGNIELGLAMRIVDGAVHSRDSFWYAKCPLPPGCFPGYACMAANCA